MPMKSKMISPHTRNTLEYAEAMRLLCDRRVVEEHMNRIDKEIRLVRRVSPSAVAQARKDVANHDNGGVPGSAAKLDKEHEYASPGAGFIGGAEEA